MQPQHPWLSEDLYPFKQNYLPLEDGRLQYVDEGKGEPLLFVHGTPTWSFLWRHQIKELAKDYRCIAPDHLGFGLSHKPNKEAIYSLEAHKNRLGQLVEHLGLQDVTLLVHDFGGPIGLGWATQNPHKVKRVIVLNSWMWPLNEVKPMMQASKLFGSSLGKFLYLRFNFSPRVLLPSAFFQKEKLTKQVHQHYLNPFQKKEERLSLWVKAKALAGETNYFQKVYQGRQALEGKPLLLLWGNRDSLIPYSFLEKWQRLFPEAYTQEVETGHFLQEEAPEEVTDAIRDFLRHN